MNPERLDRITKRVAGDEWADENTEAFVKDLARVMKSDRAVGKAVARGNEVHFTFSPTIMTSIPMVMTVREFGYDGESESLNGTITSPGNSTFRVPGGFTRDRDPKAMWKRGKGMLVDIFERAMVSSDMRTAGVADTIAKQMGGIGRLRAMLGAHSFATSGNDFSFVFPNKQRSRGNAVLVTYNAGKDLYDMEFFNVSVKGRKKVASYDDLYFDDLISIFERQTGWALRL